MSATQAAHAAATARVTRLLRALTTASAIYADGARLDVGLPRSDLNALGLLSQATADGEALSAGELGHRLGLSASATTALVDRLQGLGHVRRVRHPHDGRKVVIDVTASAQETGRRAFGPLAEALAESLAPFDPEQLADAAAVMEAVLAAVEDAARDRPRSEH
ncbi:MarR family winged helix-turn-helix transcriptional regulator [Propioniciclava soli]|uniref:MarR family winged helix-turn-helix transcriptional regulator n=1 Tax=Propioniciclava soli TaxID=2775081 RepID=UPI001E576682